MKRGLWLVVSMLATIVSVGFSEPPPPKPDPAKLVEELGSAKYATREAAAIALEKLGGEALSALKDAREAKDPEVRSRAAAILGKIESGELEKPTLVKLDYENVTIDEFVKRFNERSTYDIALFPDNLPEWKTKRITLKTADPVPLLQAIDQVAEAASVRINTVPPGWGGAMKNTRFQLFADPGHNFPTLPSVYHGPFRVSVESTHHHRDVMLAQRGGVAITRNALDRFFLNLQLSAEPRFNSSMIGAIKLTEALDDQGRSLLKTAANNTAQQPQPNIGMGMGMGGMNHMMMVNGSNFSNGPMNQVMMVELAYPQNPAALIASLKGSIPITVSARRSDPLIIALDGSAGKTFTNEQVQITVHEVKETPDQRMTVDLTIRPTENPTNTNPQMGMGGFPAQNYISLLEFQDESGDPFQAYPATNIFTNGVARVTMNIDSNFNGGFMGQGRVIGPPGMLPMVPPPVDAQKAAPKAAPAAPAPNPAAPKDVPKAAPAAPKAAPAPAPVPPAAKEAPAPKDAPKAAPGAPAEAVARLEVAAKAIAMVRVQVGGQPIPVAAGPGVKKRVVRRLVYHGTIQTTLTIPFEFKNLPMP